jgi:hypothetical protein
MIFENPNGILIFYFIWQDGCHFIALEIKAVIIET